MESDQASDLPITWKDVTKENVQQLQRLNTNIFPVKYHEAFYKEALNAPDGFFKLAFFKNLLVGAVCCRIEPHGSTPDQSQGNSLSPLYSSVGSRLYIMTLGVLAPYRERGIGKKLITHVLNLVESSPLCEDVTRIYLHVQEGNEDALRFYARFGFQISHKVVGYYRRINPPDCFVIFKTIKRP